jgi:hypothetical protein
MKKLFITSITALLLATGTAHAQRECGNYNCGFLGHPSTWTHPWGRPRAPQTTPSVRPINISPAGRPYDAGTPTYLKATSSQRKARQKLEQMQ